MDHLNPSPLKVTRLAALHREALRLVQMKALVEGPNNFGVMSAWTPVSRSKNQTAQGDLLGDLGRLGYRPRFTKLRAFWKDEGSGHVNQEQSLLLPGIKPEHLFNLGRKYDQDAVIYKSKDGVLGMYHLRSNQVEVAVQLDGTIPWQQTVGKDLYSKARGNSFSFEFLWGQNLAWDGHAPVGARQVMDAVKSGQIKPVA